MADPWILATRNAGKLRELRDLFASHDISAIDLSEAGVAADAEAEEVIESFDSFEENALAKARYFSVQLPGRIVVADDSGLVVDALGGAPGVRSKRWSGRADLEGPVLDASNNALLLSRLAGETMRAARFVCAAAWCDGVSEHLAMGEVRGRIVDKPVGEHGFGYDPHLFVEDLGKTMAEATMAEKRRVGHRGRAFARLIRELNGALRRPLGVNRERSGS